MAKRATAAATAMPAGRRDKETKRMMKRRMMIKGIYTLFLGSGKTLALTKPTVSHFVIGDSRIQYK